MLSFVTQILVVCGVALHFHPLFPQPLRSFSSWYSFYFVHNSLYLKFFAPLSLLSLCRTLTFLSATTVMWVRLHVFTSTNWPAQKVIHYTWYLSSGPAWWNHQVNRMWHSIWRVCIYIIGLAQLFLESSLAKCEGCPTICGFIFGTINRDESVGEGWGLALIKSRTVSSI